MTISFRTARNLGLIITLAIIFMVSLFSYLIMSQSAARLGTIINIDEVKLHRWYDVAEIISHAKDHLYDYRLGRSEVVAPVDLLINRALKEIASIRELATDVDELASIDDIVNSASRLRQAVYAYEVEVREGYRGGSSTKEIEEIAIKAAAHITQLGREAAGYVSKRIEEKNRAILASSALSEKVLGLVLALAIIAILTNGFFMSKALARPITQLADGTRKLANGDLSYRVEVESRDEIGQLASSFNFMAEELRKSRQKLVLAMNYTDNILMSMTNSLVVVNQDTTIRTVNYAICDLLGYGEAELIGVPFHKIFAPGHYNTLGIDKLIANVFTSSVETVFQTKKGDKVPVLCTSSVIFDNEGHFEAIVCLAHDITVQAEAMRAGHLASLGEMAAGVAHEINNPINGIINFAQIMIDDLDKGGKPSRDIPQRIIREGDRVATIVRSLLSFARESDRTRKPVNINEVMTEVLTMTEAQIHKDGIILSLDIPPSLPEIAADFQQIQQVLLNIINNARYALNSRYPESQPQKLLRVSGREKIIADRPMVELSFYDQGTGIPANVVDKVINPFFTTKPAGRGTGLGLAISHGIITDHDGQLLIESIENEFTRVTIRLPRLVETQGNHDERKALVPGNM